MQLKLPAVDQEPDDPVSCRNCWKSSQNPPPNQWSEWFGLATLCQEGNHCTRHSEKDHLVLLGDCGCQERCNLCFLICRCYWSATDAGLGMWWRTMYQAIVAIQEEKREEQSAKEKERREN